MESTLSKKITAHFFFIFGDIFINFICNFFQSSYFIFHNQKVAVDCKEQNKKNHDNWLKNKKVIQCKKMSKKCPKYSKMYSLKIHKVLELKKTQNLSK